MFCLFAFASVSRAEEALRVSSCQVKSDPAAYNHKLIELTAFVSHGFEDFALFDPECPSWPSIWLEYGGTVSSGTIYCCLGAGDPSRRQPPMVIEEVPIPLVNDERFQEFDRLIQRRPDSLLRATIVGRFFSGDKRSLATGVFWGGYGHMGCCSLLAIQQVVSAEPQNRTDLDYRAPADQPEIGKAGCGYRFLVPLESTAAFLAAQREAESGHPEWAFSDPQRVASMALAKFRNVDSTLITGLRRRRQSQGRVVYEWKPKGEAKSYLVVASRPYWLSFYAKDPANVAWMIIAAYELSCR